MIVTLSQTYPAWPQESKTHQMFEFVWLRYCIHSETPRLDNSLEQKIEKLEMAESIQAVYSPFLD